MKRKTIDDTLGGFGDLAESAKTEQAAAEHATDFSEEIAAAVGMKQDSIKDSF